MRLSKRGEYGIRSMLYMAKHSQPGALVQLKQIAEKENIPVKYLEQILLALRHAGLLHSRMGIGGGYTLAKSAGNISLGRIVRTLDGPLAPVNCAIARMKRPAVCGWPCSMCATAFPTYSITLPWQTSLAAPQGKVEQQPQRNNNYFPNTYRSLRNSRIIFFLV